MLLVWLGPGRKKTNKLWQKLLLVAPLNNCMLVKWKLFQLMCTVKQLTLIRGLGVFSSSFFDDYLRESQRAPAGTPSAKKE